MFDGSSIEKSAAAKLAPANMRRRAPKVTSGQNSPRRTL